MRDNRKIGKLNNLYLLNNWTGHQATTNVALEYNEITFLWDPISSNVPTWITNGLDMV